MITIYDVTRMIEEFFAEEGNRHITGKFMDGKGGFCWYGAYDMIRGLWKDDDSFLTFKTNIEPDTERLITLSPIFRWNDDEEMSYQEINRLLIEDYEEKHGRSTTD